MVGVHQSFTLLNQLAKAFFLYVISLDIEYRESSLGFLTNPFVICCKTKEKVKVKTKNKNLPRRPGMRAVQARALLDWLEPAAPAVPEPQPLKATPGAGKSGWGLGDKQELLICFSKSSLTSL